MRIVYLKNFRKGYATNSSSTHSVIYRNKEELFNDLNVFELNYYDRCDETIAASKEAKIKYVAANIFSYNELFDIMCSIYPEMQEYRKMAEQQKVLDGMTFGERHSNNCENDVFGSASRGRLYFYNIADIEPSIEYLKYIIENDDIIIIGGSDELDFVYNTVGNHKCLTIPCDISEVAQGPSVFKNGNYYVAYGFGGDRLRFSVSNEECIPEYPELIDLKITNKCDQGCPFCYMDSTMSGKDGDINKIKGIIKMLTPTRYDKFNRKIEFSIGGGNVLLYPNLGELFSYIKESGFIVNTTINIRDCEKLKNDPELLKLFKAYVKGLGLSVSSVEDLDYFIDIAEDIQYECNIVLHLIPEILGVEKTLDIMNRAYKIGIYQFLFLGFKTNGRGATQTPFTFNDKDLRKLFGLMGQVGVDTSFLNRYKDWLSTHYAVAKTATYNEGEFSMYIDGVEGFAYKSSYNLEKPYKVVWDYNRDVPYLSPIQAFQNIRKDGGLKCAESMSSYN